MKKKKVLFLIFVLTFILSVFCSCFSSDEVKISLEVGQTYDFYLEENAKYYSSDTLVATVDENGVITAKSVGECIVTASTLDKSKKISLTVVEKSIPLPDYFIEIEVGETYAFSGGDMFSSDNTGIAEVDSQGVIVGIDVGECRVTFTENGTQKIIQVTVKEKTISYQAYFTLNTNGGEVTDEKWISCGNGKYYTEENTSLPTPQREGYNFTGWYYEEQQVTELTQGGSATAKWELIKYKINYELNGGQNNELNVTEYDYFSTLAITLYEPCKDGEVFVGWYKEADFVNEITEIIPSKSEITVYAKFSAYYEVNYKYNSPDKDGVVKVAIGNKMSVPEIECENGYFIEWFTDEDCTESYNFYNSVENSFTIYGKEFKEVTQSFFSSENYKPDGVIDSKEEFMQYIEYIYFNQITTVEYVQINYSEFNNYTDTELKEILKNSTMPFEAISYGEKTSMGKKYFYVVLTKTFPETLKTYTPDESDYPQQIYDVEFSKLDNFVSERSENFDDFKYNNLEKSVEVKNTDQLFYALEHRVKPIPVKGSGAETALEKCKQILRKICDDTLTDVEKAKNIYTYLVKNVDYVLPTYSTVSEAMSYDAFYMEGVLNNGAGVCDGISKTFSCLMNIEGIRCVRATSDDHAWNEAFINGKWFTIDATHGNASTSSGLELLTYDNFMINETIKESYGYADKLRTEIVADGVYDYYANNYFTYNEKTYDYNIDSALELSYLFRVAKSIAKDNSQTTFSVGFVLNNYNKTTAGNVITKAKTLAGISLSFSYYPMLEKTDSVNIIVVFS